MARRSVQPQTATEAATTAWSRRKMPRARRPDPPEHVLMHWRPTHQTADGSACGLVGVPFTARPTEVECKACITLMERTLEAEQGGHDGRE